MPKVVTSGGRAIRRQLGREGRALMNGTTALEKRPQRGPSAFLPCGDTMRSQTSVLYNLPSQWGFVAAARTR